MPTKTDIKTLTKVVNDPTYSEAIRAGARSRFKVLKENPEQLEQFGRRAEKQFLEGIAQKRKELGLNPNPPSYSEPSPEEIGAVERRARKAAGMSSFKDRLFDLTGN